MLQAAVCLAAAFLGSSVWAGSSARREAPSYSASSVVNAASSTADQLAPNTIATIYGKNLAFDTRTLQASDISGAVLPITLAGVHVLVQNEPAPLLYVSPAQINFVLPSNLQCGTCKVQVTIDGQAGPAVNVALRAAAPALFVFPYTTTAIASRQQDYSVCSDDQPCQPGDGVILWVTGLGRTNPPAEYGKIATAAAYVANAGSFRILLNGTAVDPSKVLYAGLAPGFAGFYQINLMLPESVADKAEIRIAVGDDVSPAGVQLPVRHR